LLGGMEKFGGLGGMACRLSFSSLRRRRMPHRCRTAGGELGRRCRGGGIGAAQPGRGPERQLPPDKE
jgi:hypothetical protein